MDENAAGERKSGDTDEQFYYKARKKAIGPFKREFWSLHEDVRGAIAADLERTFAFLFEQLNVNGTEKDINRFVQAPMQHHAALKPALVGGRGRPRRRGIGGAHAYVASRAGKWCTSSAGAMRPPSGCSGARCSAPGLALLYAPRTGEETRRVLQRKLWKLRAMTEEKLDELAQQFGGGKEALDDLTDDDDEDFDDGGEAPRRSRPGAAGRLGPRGARAPAGRVPRAPAGRRRPRGAARLKRRSGPAGGTGRPPASSAAPCRPPTKTTSRSWPAR